MQSMASPTMTTIPSLTDLWDTPIPGSLYQNAKTGEWGEWRIKEIEAVTFDGHQGCFVLIANSEGHSAQGVSSPGPYCCISATCDALQVATTLAEDGEHAAPDYSFDQLADLIWDSVNR
jgi:hypothetical protein